MSVSWPGGITKYAVRVQFCRATAQLTPETAGPTSPTLDSFRRPDKPINEKLPSQSRFHDASGEGSVGDRCTSIRSGGHRSRGYRLRPAHPSIAFAGDYPSIIDALDRIVGVLLDAC